MRVTFDLARASPPARRGVRNPPTNSSNNRFSSESLVSFATARHSAGAREGRVREDARHFLRLASLAIPAIRLSQRRRSNA